MNIKIKPIGIIATIAISTILVVRCASSDDAPKMPDAVEKDTPAVVLAKPDDKPIVADTTVVPVHKQDTLVVKKSAVAVVAATVVDESDDDDDQAAGVPSTDPMLGQQADYQSVPMLIGTIYKYKRVNPNYVRVSFSLYGEDQLDLVTRYVPTKEDKFKIGMRYYIALLVDEPRTVYKPAQILPIALYNDRKGQTLCFTYKSKVYISYLPAQFEGVQITEPMRVLVKE